MIQKFKLITEKYNINKINSAIIQAEFYSKCKLNEIICYLEFKEKNSRFDALIFDKNLHKKIIVEIKSYKDKNKKANLQTKQIKKYQKFGLPIFIITRIEEIDETIKKIKDII